jgi:hypothetical protein
VYAPAGRKRPFIPSEAGNPFFGKASPASRNFFDPSGFYPQQPNQVFSAPAVIAHKG